MESARRRFPDLWMPNRSDLCFATTNRQAALKAIASESDAVVVIGSANSSNTVALEKVARAGGLPPGTAHQRGRRAARRSHRHGGGDGGCLGTRGTGRGGHRPPRTLPRGSTEVTVTTEDEYFPPPPELRELLRAVGSMLGFFAGRGRPVRTDPAAEDRSDLGCRRARPAGLMRAAGAMIGP